jgi:hypothetical protein
MVPLMPWEKKIKPTHVVGIYGPNNVMCTPLGCNTLGHFHIGKSMWCGGNAREV